MRQLRWTLLTILIFSAFLIFICDSESHESKSYEIKLTPEVESFSAVSDDWYAPHINPIGVIVDYKRLSTNFYRITVRFKENASLRSAVYFMIPTTIYAARELGYRYHASKISNEREGDFVVTYWATGNSPDEVMSASNGVVSFDSVIDMDEKDFSYLEKLFDNPVFVSYESTKNITQGAPLTGYQEMELLYRSIKE